MKIEYASDQVNGTIVNLINSVRQEDLDRALKSLGNLHDDEERAREQLKDIEEFLKASKDKMRSYKLPIISDNYFVELKEANEAIEEVIKELERKPIVIKTLNTRVDTARDLVLKLYNTTNEMVKTATLAEKCMVYSNRYRAFYDQVDIGLTKAEDYFYKGEYKKSLDAVLKACALVDEEIYKRMLAIYDE
jgi:septation ring formation regulator EzrA